MYSREEKPEKPSNENPVGKGVLLGSSCSRRLGVEYCWQRRVCMERKKKILGVLCCTFAVALVAALVAIKETQAARPIRLVVNGRDIACDVPPFIKDGRTFVPVRFIAEALGYPVKWDERTWTVYVGAPPEGLDLVTELKPFRMDASADISLMSIKPIRIAGTSYNHGYYIGTSGGRGSLYWNLGKRSPVSNSKIRWWLPTG